MTDFERCLDDEGVPDGYTFFQDGVQIILTFPIPPTASPSDIDFSIFDDDRSIRAGLRGADPSICSTMFDSVFHTDLSHAGSTCRITLQKLSDRDWPLFISEPVGTRIDPKSLFMLGVYSDACARPRAAWRHFLASADRGFVPAKLVVASALLNDGNPYSVASDASEGIRVLSLLPPAAVTVDVRLVLFRALARAGRASEARAVVSEAARESDIAKWELVRFLEGDGGAARERVAALEDLAAAGHALACRELARLYAGGRCVRTDLARARELAERAARIDPALPAELPDEGVGGNFAATAGATVAFLGVAAVAWAFFPRRRVV